jgi:hypothetical protein
MTVIMTVAVAVAVACAKLLSENELVPFAGRMIPSTTWRKSLLLGASFLQKILLQYLYNSSVC